MADDVSVKQVDLLRGYTNQLRRFNEAVNLSITAFRRSSKQKEEELQEELRRIQHNVNQRYELLDSKLRELLRLKESFTFGDEDLNTIECAVQLVKSQRQSLQTQLEAVKASYRNLFVRLQQLDSRATMFSVSNQQLLEGANNRLEHHLLALDKYKDLTT